MRTKRRGERGSGLVLSLIALATLSVLALTVYRITRSQVRESIYVLRQTQAHYIARAGLEQALYRLSRDTTWRAGFQKQPLGGGDFTVSISTDDPPWIDSTGYSAPLALIGPAVITVRARAEYVWAKGAVVHAGWQPGTWTQSYRRQ